MPAFSYERWFVVAGALEGSASVAFAQFQSEAAAALIGEAQRLREATGIATDMPLTLARRTRRAVQLAFGAEKKPWPMR